MASKGMASGYEDIEECALDTIRGKYDIFHVLIFMLSKREHEGRQRKG